MAAIPNLETLLLEIRKSLGLKNRYSTDKNDDFCDHGLSLATHRAMMVAEFDAIFEALEMDTAARWDISDNILNWVNFNQAVAQNIWTCRASPQQVLWHMSAYSYAPALGRLVANWNLGQAFDAGMPGGEFWFLPMLDESRTRVSLPVPHVLAWLMDLLGLPMDEIKKDLGGERAKRANAHDSMERSLYNWKAGKALDTKSIEKYFPDDAALHFDGVFELEAGLTDAERFGAALAFVERKGLDAAILRAQIPMTQPGRIEAILAGTAAGDEQQTFVDRLATRYARPAMRTVRQRLRVARMMQDAYERLVECLCPEVEATCPDPYRNKVLQLLELFKAVFNLTIEAHKHGADVKEENEWFEAQIPPLDAATLFLSILPSRFDTAYQELSGFLTRRFAELEPDAPLANLVPVAEADLPRIVAYRLQQLASDAADERQVGQVLERIRRSSAWRILQSVDNYWVVSQVAQTASLSPKARSAATQRMRELASTPWHVIGAVFIDLHMAFDTEGRDRPRDLEERVESLLAEAEASPAREAYASVQLQYRAKHHLARNDFETAKKLFRDALDAGAGQQFGPSRGEIARDLLAVEVANGRLVPGNHEKPYRHMLVNGMIEGNEPSLENVAAGAAEYFWDTLYQPYPSYPSKRPMAAEQVKKIIGETMGLIERADWEGLRVWLTRNAGNFRKKQLRYVRGDSLLMIWLKMLHTFEDKLPELAAQVPAELQGEVVKMRAHVVKQRQALYLLIDNWPEQANLQDFKGQTPLMLAADRRDLPMVRVLLEAGANLNLQDYLGRTALHSAVTGASPDCVSAILARGPDFTRVSTAEGNSALHTAVRMGYPAIVSLLKTPKLVKQTNHADLTPGQLMVDILGDLPGWRDVMRRTRRKTGTDADDRECAAELGLT
jgi:hypothetical protein